MCVLYLCHILIWLGHISRAQWPHVACGYHAASVVRRHDNFVKVKCEFLRSRAFQLSSNIRASPTHSFSASFKMLSFTFQIEATFLPISAPNFPLLLGGYFSCPLEILCVERLYCMYLVNLLQETNQKEAPFESWIEIPLDHPCCFFLGIGQWQLACVCSAVMDLPSLIHLAGGLRW